MPADTSTQIADQISKVEAAASGLNVRQHSKVKEARELVDKLKHKKKELVTQEQAEKKRKRAHRERIEKEDREDDREEKRQKHGSDVRQWAKAMEKAVKKGGDATIHAVEKMMREYKKMLDDERDM